MANSFQTGKRNLRAAIDFLKSAGAAQIKCTRGKHYKITAERDGKKINAVLSVTPSDYRSSLNTICQIKRQLRSIDGGAS